MRGSALRALTSSRIARTVAKTPALPDGTGTVRALMVTVGAAYTRAMIAARGSFVASRRLVGLAQDLDAVITRGAKPRFVWFAPGMHHREKPEKVRARQVRQQLIGQVVGGVLAPSLGSRA